MNSHKQLEEKTPKVIREMKKCRAAIAETLEAINRVTIDDFRDNLQIKCEQIIQKNIELPIEESKQIEKSLLTQNECKKILDSMDKIEQLMTLLTPDFSDPKYLQFECLDRKVKQPNLQKQAIVWEQAKQSQKERFTRYNTEQMRESIQNLDEKLTETFEYTLHYVQGGLKKTIQVKLHDLLKLNPPNYLNDSIINFYLKFLENDLISPVMRQKTFIFNTYFMEKLCPYDKLQAIQQNDQPRLNELFRQCYENIKKWVKEDLFEKDYVLFPLNLPEHWSLLIAYKPVQAFKGEDKSYIVYLDSFGIMDQKIISIIKMYLHRLYMDKHQYDVQYAESPMKSIPSFQPLAPRQVNYIDCGVFLLEYAESFLNNPDYLIKDIDGVDSIDKLKWFPRCLVNQKRFLIKQLLIDLTRENKELAIQKYKEQRQQIIQQNVDNVDEFDVIDDELFTQFLQQRGVSNPNSEQYRQLVLDFYMNPQQNYYHTDHQI